MTADACRKKETNGHICITAVFPFSFHRAAITYSVWQKMWLSPPLPTPPMWFTVGKKETRCACVSKEVARGRSLWSSLCWMHLVCPWHFPSLLDTHASCWGGQVLLGLSYIHPQSRCLTNTDTGRDTHTHTHTDRLHKGVFGRGQMWYIYQLIIATEEVLDGLERWKPNFRPHFSADSCWVCVKYEYDEDMCKWEIVAVHWS